MVSKSENVCRRKEVRQASRNCFPFQFTMMTLMKGEERGLPPVIASARGTLNRERAAAVEVAGVVARAIGCSAGGALGRSREGNMETVSRFHAAMRAARLLNNRRFKASAVSRRNS